MTIAAPSQSVRRQVFGEKKMKHSNRKPQVCTYYQNQVVFPNLAASEITRAQRISIATWQHLAPRCVFTVIPFQMEPGEAPGITIFLSVQKL